MSCRPFFIVMGSWLTCKLETWAPGHLQVVSFHHFWRDGVEKARRASQLYLVGKFELFQ
jgi:hypothetical protein